MAKTIKKNMGWQNCALKILLQIGVLLLSTGECLTVAPLDVSIKMITYNVRNYNDGAYWGIRSQAIAQTITEHLPDIVLLQEIRQGPLGDMFEDMKKLLPDYACDGCQFRYNSMTYSQHNCGGCSEGYAIFTLQPMVQYSNRSLVFSGQVDQNQRAANRIVMKVPGFKGDECTVNVFGVHLSDAEQEQLSNIADVLQWINDTRVEDHLGVAHVIIGDFNAKYGKWNAVNKLMKTMLDVDYADVQPQPDELHPTNCTYRCDDFPPSDQTNQRDRFVVPNTMDSDDCCDCVMIGNTSGGSTDNENVAWLEPSDHSGLLCTMRLETANIAHLCQWDDDGDDDDDDDVNVTTTTVSPTRPLTSTPLPASSSWLSTIPLTSSLTSSSASHTSSPLASSSPQAMSESVSSTTPPTLSTLSTTPKPTPPTRTPSTPSPTPPPSSPPTSSLPTIGLTTAQPQTNNTKTPTRVAATTTSHSTTADTRASPSLETSSTSLSSSTTPTTPAATAPSVVSTPPTATAPSFVSTPSTATAPSVVSTPPTAAAPSVVSTPTSSTAAALPSYLSTLSTTVASNTTSDEVLSASTSLTTPTLTTTNVTTATTATTKLNASAKSNAKLPVPVAGIVVTVVGVMVLVAAVVALGRKQMLGNSKQTYGSHENLIFNDSSVYGEPPDLYHADEQVFTMQESDA